MNIGKKMKEVRKRNCLTQEQLANKVGISLMSIRRYEKDERSPNMKTLKKIAAALDVPISDLIEGDAAATMQASQAILNDFTSNPQNWHKAEPGELTELVNAQREERLKKAYYSMNEAGQEKAVERVEELTEVPKYKKK